MCFDFDGPCVVLSGLSGYINMLRTLLESDYQESPALDSEAISTQAGIVTSGILQNS